MNPNQTNAFYAYFILIFTILAISFCLIMDVSIRYGFLTILMVTYGIARHFEYHHRAIAQMMFKGIRKVRPVIIMLSLIGMSISLWMQLGTIPALIFYGFKYLSHMNIVLAAFIISSIISMGIGTAIGTLSIVTPVFMGLAVGLEIPYPLIVGAMVSGAYLGDRTSPVSSSANLTALVTDSLLIENVKKMLFTLAPAFWGTCILYYSVGAIYIPTPESLTKVNDLQNLILNNFDTRFVVFLPFVVLLSVMILFKKSMVKALGYSLATTAFLLLSLHKMTFRALLTTAYAGYFPAQGDIIELISGSGLISMLGIFWIILISTAFNGILEETGLIDPLLHKIKEGAKSPSSLMHRAGLLSVLVTIVTCNQTLTAIITGNTFKEAFKEQGISTSYLARAISDFGMILVPIIPWNVNAILVASLTGISAVKYGPLAYFSLLLPIVGFIYPWFQHRQCDIKPTATSNSL